MSINANHDLQCDILKIIKKTQNTVVKETMNMGLNY